MMKKIVVGMGLVFMAQQAGASAVGGFVSAGYSSAKLEVDFDDGSNLELDNGNGWNLAGGVRFAPGILVRGSYTTTNHDHGSACITGVGCGSGDADIDLSETRVGGFYAPASSGPVSFLVGAGYEKLTLSDNDADEDSDIDGGFLEAGIGVDAGRVVTFEGGASYLFLTDDADEDETGWEGKLGVVFHAGPVDLGARARRIALSGDVDDNTITEYQFTVGGHWGYPQ